MGVDYDGVGGIGLEVDLEITDAMLKNNLFTEEELEDSVDECLEVSGFTYASAGNHYSGDIRHYIFVEGENLKQINENVASFFQKLKKIGIHKNTEDLIVISDMCVW